MEESNKTLAVEKFQARLLNLSLSYYHDEPIPDNETKGDAFIKCSDEEKAKKYCPKRWEAMMKWFDFSRMVCSFPNNVPLYHKYFFALSKYIYYQVPGAKIIP